MLSCILVWCNWGGNNGCASTGEFRSDESDTTNISGSISTAEAEFRGKLSSNSLTEEERDGSATLLIQRDVESTSNRILSAVLVTSEEYSETLCGTGRVRFSQDTDDLGVREPFRNLTTVTETAAKFSTRDVESTDTSWDLIFGTVLVTVWKVGHHLEGDDFNTKLRLVFLNSVLCIVWTIEFLALAILSWTGMITANDEMSRTEILADNGVPDSFTRTTHSHSQRQETENSHAVRISWEKSLVNTNSGEMVDISRLCKTDNRVDENIGLAGTSSTDSQLTMSSVHWISSLEGNNL
jgi:hypothetical protein